MIHFLFVCSEIDEDSSSESEEEAEQSSFSNVKLKHDLMISNDVSMIYKNTC